MIHACCSGGLARLAAATCALTVLATTSPAWGQDDALPPPTDPPPMLPATRPDPPGARSEVPEAEPSEAEPSAPEPEPSAPEAEAEPEAEPESRLPDLLPQCHAQAPPCDDEAKLLLTILDGLKGGSLIDRIASYEAYVETFPDGRYAAVLWEEAQQLRMLVVFRTDAEAVEASDDEPKGARFEMPWKARAAEPLTIALEVDGEVTAVRLMWRGGRDRAFASRPMRAAGPRHYTATLSAEDTAVSEVQFFVEAERADDGEPVALLGSRSEPRVLALEDAEETAVLDAERQVALTTDYADFNRVRGNDWLWQTEGSFGLRFDDVGIRALRTGFGIYRGVGGGVDELDEQDRVARQVGLTYGWLETEIGFHEIVSLVARGVAGAGNAGLAGGAQALLRLGNDRRHNVMFGGEVLAGVGLRAILEVQLMATPRLPVSLRTEVTNQPVGARHTGDAIRPVEDAEPAEIARERTPVAGRVIVGAGYEIVDGFLVGARASYQARDIDHGGPGFGGIVRYRW